MTTWEEKKQQAIKDNNLLLVNAMMSFEIDGDAEIFVKVIELLQARNQLWGVDQS